MGSGGGGGRDGEGWGWPGWARFPWGKDGMGTRWEMALSKAGSSP